MSAWPGSRKKAALSHVTSRARRCSTRSTRRAADLYDQVADAATSPGVGRVLADPGPPAGSSWSGAFQVDCDTPFAVFLVCSRPTPEVAAGAGAGDRVPGALLDDQFGLRPGVRVLTGVRIQQ